MLTTKSSPLCRRNRRLARQKWGLGRNHPLLAALKSLTEDLALSVSAGDVILLQSNWYVTHAGLLRIAKRNRCSGMRVQFIRELCDTAGRRFAFEATVFKSKTCRGFVGYGDADPSNVSLLVQGAELRVAETRAINRALRKAYGIGICSVEEIGSSSEQAPSSSGVEEAAAAADERRTTAAPRSATASASSSASTSSMPTSSSPTPSISAAPRPSAKPPASKSKASSAHLADWAEKDRNALLCQLNSYLGSKEGAA